MTPIDKDNIKNTILRHGLDYTFIQYSEWNEIDDKEFHKLKKSYLKTRDKLLNYIEGVEKVTPVKKKRSPRKKKSK